MPLPWQEWSGFKMYVLLDLDLLFLPNFVRNSFFSIGSAQDFGTCVNSDGKERTIVIIFLANGTLCVIERIPGK